MFESIRILEQRIIINIQCVHSELDGGAHEHLSLILSPREYALRSKAVYQQPEHPRLLVILPGNTLIMSNTL